MRGIFNVASSWPAGLPQPAHRLLRLVAGLAGSLAIALLIAYWRADPRELAIYFPAAQRMMQGEEIYCGGFTYPPFMALLMVPLAALPFRLGMILWCWAYVGMLIAIGWMIARILAPIIGSRSGPRPWVFALLLLLLSARYLLSPISALSNDILIFLAVTLIAVWSATPRERTGECGAGIAAGLGAAIKATPLLFLPAFLWQRRWLAATSLVLAATAACLLPDLIFPRLDAQLWVVAWLKANLLGLQIGAAANTACGWTGWNSLNQSLAGLIERLLRPPTPGEAAPVSVLVWEAPTMARRLIILAAQLSVFGLLLWGLQARRSNGNRSIEEQRLRSLGETGAIATAMLLLSPMSSKWHFCVLLLPMAFCLADLLYRRRDPVVALLLAFALLAGSTTAKDIIGDRINDIANALGVVTGVALAMLVATVRILRRPASPPGAPRPA